MRRLIFAFAALAVLLLFVPVSASALTVRDIVELSRAGLGDETLLALIEVDPSVFPIDTATLKSLKTAGVSERVIVAMVRSARTTGISPEAELMPPPISQPPEPQVVVIDHHDAAPEIREVPVAVPVYIPVVRESGEHARRGHGSTTESERTHHKDAEPVYWGWGGKLRPDAWQPK
jgi:hypothetical protein